MKVDFNGETHGVKFSLIPYLKLTNEVLAEIAESGVRVYGE